jgi:hypothetical protein
VITVSMSSLSTAYLQQLINVQSADGYNPSGDIVQFAFTASTYPETSPTSLNWNSGSWVVFPGPKYWAQCLVGPNGGVTLTQGLWQVWVKVTDNPEIPVLQDVFLNITP